MTVIRGMKSTQRPRLLSSLLGGNESLCFTKVVIYHPDDSASIVDLLLLTELELSPPSNTSA
jgi:hypothetical protein